MANFTLQLEQNASLVANVLGLNQWQLQTASFANISFFVVPSSWDQFNPFAPITNTAISLLNPSADPNQNLSFDTTLNMQNIRDSQSKKLSIRRLPNFDGFFIRDNGSDGIVYEMVGLIIGPDYLEAINNIQQAVNKQNGKGYDFVHPLYGKLQNCFVSNIVRLYNSSEWRACTFTLRIVQSGSNSSKPIQSSVSSIASKTLNLINGSIAAFGALSADIALSKGLLASIGIGSIGGNSTQQTTTPQQQAQQLSQAILSNRDKLQAATTLVYQQLAKPKLQVTNYTFQNATVDYNNLPSLFRYSSVRVPQFSTLLQYYADSIAATIDLYTLYGVDTVWSDNIALLKTSLVQLDNLLSTILVKVNNTYRNYTLPANYSVRQIFFYNGLDYNNWNLVQTFIEQNQAKLNDLNIIPEGTIVSVPTVSTL